MECRTLDMTIISADDLKKVNMFTKMDTYVTVSILDSTHHHDTTYVQKQKTHVDKHGNNNPKWSYPVKFTLNEAALHSNRLTLCFKVWSHRALLPDKVVGEVFVSCSDLVASVGKSEYTDVSYQVRRKRSGKPKGSINFAYKFGDKFVAVQPDVGPGPSSVYPYPYPYPSGYAEQPQYAYPAQPVGAGYGYPGQGNGYGYGYAPQMQAGPQGRRNNKFGMGMGTGLLGGALAGFLVGDMVSDIGMDGGFGDGGFGGF